MTAPQPRPWPSLPLWRRLGPAVLVVALTAGAGAVATTKGKDATPHGTEAPSGAALRELGAI